MEEIKKGPKLRFSSYCDLWIRKPFKEIVKINQGLQIAIEKRLTKQEDGSLFYITNEFLRQNSEKKYFVKDVPNSVVCNYEDVLMTRTGNTGQVVTDVEGAFHNNFFKIKYDSNISKTFLVNFLKLPKTQNLILKLAGSSTIPDLNHSDFYKINFCFPSLPEQQKIASFLTAVDTKIEQLTQKAELLQQYKKGVMQQLFSQELRFKPAPSEVAGDEEGKEYPDWEEKKLGELGSFYYGKSAPKWSISPDAPTPCIRYGELYTKFNIVVDRIYSYTNIDTANLKFSKGGEVLIPRVGEAPLDFAKCSYLPMQGIAIGEMISVFNSNENGIFLTYYLNTLRREFAKYVEGGNVSNLYFRYLENIEIRIPSSEEQTKIANFLSAIDSKIELVQTQLENTQQFKKGLLQQMFV